MKLPVNISELLVAALCLTAVPTWAVDIGADAPDFSLQGSDGKTHKLSDYRGRPVVLEWFNNDCPFVRKHYDRPEKNMQGLQERYTARDVVWLTVVSSAEGNEGYVNREGAVALQQSNGSRQTAILLDPQGTAGRAYGARTTPHMNLVSKEGKIVYQGAIDDRRTYDKADLKGAQNYIAEALEATLKGEAVTVAQTRPYGCSVKY